MTDGVMAIGMAFGVAPQPDGSFIILMKLQAPMTEFTVGFPVETGEEILRQLPGQLRAAIEDARRQASGIVVASSLPKHPLGGQAHG